MLPKFGDLPFRTKLTIIVTFTSLFIVGVLAVFFLTDKITAFRRNMVQNIATLAEVVGINSTASLTFEVPETATEILGALSAEPQIALAAVLRRDGSLFAVYQNPVPSDSEPADAAFFQTLQAGFADPIDPRQGGHLFSAEYLDVIHPIRLKDEVIGFVIIRADLSALNTRIMHSVVVVLGLTTLLFLFVHIISKRLHRSVVDPLAELTRAMEAVSEHRDYSVPVSRRNNDEVGALISGFNDMLIQIRKRDAALAEHRDRLEEAVAERTRELTRSNGRLKAEMEERIKIQEQLSRAQKMEAIGTLAAGVAHDLNNILSGIVSYPDLLLMNLPEDSPMRKPVLTIQGSGLKAAAIVQDLLTLARRGVAHSEVMDLKGLVHAHIQSPVHQKLCRHHPGVRIETRLDPDVMNINGSPVHLDKTLMNLIGNAAEAMDDGGVITIELGNRYVDRPVPGYDTIQEGDYVVLTVTDTGIGIPQEDIQHIFEPFYTKKKMGRSGTGLGMAVVWGTVKDHQGYIDVESRVGEGTTFQLYFPATRSAVREAGAVASAKPLRGDGQTILVVDDVAEQREIASQILEALGYRAHAVATGEAAVEYMTSGNADLILLDMIMDPGIDGLETYRRILDLHPGQGAVIASGFSETARVKKVQQLGAGAYLRKPYTLEKIAGAVKEALSEQGRAGGAEGRSAEAKGGVE